MFQIWYRKKEIIQDAEEVAKKFLEKLNSEQQINTTINVVKKYMSYIKIFDVDSFFIYKWKYNG